MTAPPPLDYRSPPAPDDHDIEEQTGAGEMISAAEERFERWRKTAGVVLAPLAFVLTWWLVSANSGLKPEGRALSAILVGVAVLWITETLPLPVTALLGALLCILLRVADAKAVLAPFADPIVFLFIGSFMLARAMTIHGLDRRIALGFLSVRWVSAHPARVLAGMGFVTAGLSMWVSNTATTAMMLPIAIGILTALHEVRVARGQARPGPLDARAWPFATAMMLMIAYSASIGGIGTPVGSPPNLIGIGQLRTLAKVDISFFRWMAVMVPMLVLMAAALFVLLYWMHPERKGAAAGTGAPADRFPRAQAPVAPAGAVTPLPEEPEPHTLNVPNYSSLAVEQRHAEEEAKQMHAADIADYLAREKALLGPWTAGQVNTAIAFGVAVVLWVAPGFIQIRLGEKHEFYKQFAARLPEAAVAVLAALLLFVLPTDRKSGKATITWSQAVKIDWGTILLFGGGLSLGTLMFSTGVAQALGNAVTGTTGATSVWALTATAIVMGIFLSETTSNTTAATMVVPVIIAAAQSAGISPVPPALGAVLGASYGFMLPVSTPPNAIVYGSGLVPIPRMIRAGVVFDVLGFFIILAGLRILCPLLGLM